MTAGFTLFVSNGPVVIGSDEEESIYLAQDQVYGQAEMMFSTPFSRYAANLGDKLGNGGWTLPKTFCDNWYFNCGPVQPNQIERLGICCHGDSGAIGINGAPYSNPNKATWKDPAWLNTTTISSPTYQDSFQKSSGRWPRGPRSSSSRAWRRTAIRGSSSSSRIRSCGRPRR